MKPTTMTRLSGLLTALLLAGTAAFAQLNKAQDQPATHLKAGATVDLAATLKVIQSSAFDTREELLTGIETRVRTADIILAGLTIADTAKADIRKTADALTKSISNARSLAAANWEKARTELADRYSAYAEVVIRAEQSTLTAGK